MKQEQLPLFEIDVASYDLSGVDGDGLCEGEEIYSGELVGEWCDQDKQAG
jgi:hypothetical protein